MVVMRRNRTLERAPGLVDFQHADDIGSPQARVVTGAERAEARGTGAEDSSGNNVVDARLIVGGLFLKRQCARNTVSELGGIAELVHTGDRAATTDETVEDVARIVD